MLTDHCTTVICRTGGTLSTGFHWAYYLPFLPTSFWHLLACLTTYFQDVCPRLPLAS